MRATETRRDLLVLGLGALALRLPTFFAPRHLTFDDGVFGASAVAMRDGGVPFRDVFSSQGPLFLPLVWIADTLGLHTLNGPRLLGLASGVAVVVALYLAGREIAGPEGGRVAGALGAVTGSSIAVTGSIASDGPAMALAAFAVLVALRYQVAPSTGRAAATGVLIGCALMVKAIVVPVAVPVGLILLWSRADRRGDQASTAPLLAERSEARQQFTETPLHMCARFLRARRPKDWVVAVGASVLVAVSLFLAFGWSDVWDQSIAYHTDAPGSSTPGANLNKIVSTFFTRDLVIVAAALVALVAVVVARRRGAPPPEAGDGEPRTIPVPVLLWLWFAAMTVMLVLHHPLWRPHLSSLVAPAALLVAWYRPPWKAFLATGAAATAFMVLTYAGPTLLWAGDYEGDEAAVVDALRDLPEGAWAISDEPGQVWRSGHRTPDRLVDASSLLTGSGRLTGEDIAEEAGRPQVCAVVVWSNRFGGFEDLPERLAAEGYEVAERYDEVRTLYLRKDCAPPG